MERHHRGMDQVTPNFVGDNAEPVALGKVN